MFERGAKGRTGASLPAPEVPQVDPAALYGDLFRKQQPGLAEVSEPEAVRHYVQLSQQNFAIDTGMYPLGSCTMKYNPKVNEWAARLPGFATLHPLTPDSMAQGALELMYRLEQGLAQVCGMDRVSLQPAAGAQGEYVGLQMIRAYHTAQGRSPKKVLIPETAHGTNPASCALNGFTAVPFPMDEHGIVLPEQLPLLVDDDVAAIMVTNPNTVGLFETHMATIAEMVHAKGGLVYGDGANLNAIMGRGRPGDFGIDVMQFNLHKTFTTPHGGGGPGCGPVGYKKILDPSRPCPCRSATRTAPTAWTTAAARRASVACARSTPTSAWLRARTRTCARWGPRACAWPRISRCSTPTTCACLGETWKVAFDRTCMHEVVISDKHPKDTHVTTMDVAKRPDGLRLPPPTVYFPLVVKGAMLIEPTGDRDQAGARRLRGGHAGHQRRGPPRARDVTGAPHLTRLRRLTRRVRLARRCCATPRLLALEAIPAAQAVGRPGDRERETPGGGGRRASS
ncbi:MAG: aminomethyl-transferring glycine dehydrogenase subunit GcvPB [Sandaracinaceae bacterium]|nr:aminomethyl-transferring glycine dehydrogenase subunit GcvPB [Sandaracinaceae bacterium]